MVIDTEVCLAAPDRLWWSGVGDLVAKVTAVMDSARNAFPWPALVTHGLILAGVVLAYGNLEPFARALLGPSYWAYSVMLLLLAVIPIFGMGKILYAYISNRIERWER